MKKIIALFMICITLITLASCGGVKYEDAEEISELSSDEYFTIVKRFGDSLTTQYSIAYANDSKVMYLIVDSGYGYGITPLYNADGTLQVYEE